MAYHRDGLINMRGLIRYLNKNIQVCGYNEAKYLYDLGKASLISK